MKFTTSSPLATLLLLSIFIFNACTPTDEKPFSDYSVGTFVLCEGANGGNGSVSFYNRTSKSIKNDIFATANNAAALGNTPVSMTLLGKNIYIPVNNSDKLQIVEANTFLLQSNITGLSKPRYFEEVRRDINGQQAYITEGGAGVTGDIRVIDISAKTKAVSIYRTVILNGIPDKIINVGAVTYILNKDENDSTIFIMDSFAVDTLYKTLKVAPAPNSFVRDANGDIWVICNPKTSKSQLVKVRFTNDNVYFDIQSNASSIITDKTGYNLYYIANNKIWQKDLKNFGTNPPTLLEKQPSLTKPNALGIDPITGYLYIADAKDKTSNGQVYILDVANKIIVDSVAVGVNPNGFLFR